MVSAIWGILVYIITMLAFSGTSKSILAVIGSYISYISGPTCGIFLLAMLTKKANDKGTVCGAVFGFIIKMCIRDSSGLVHCTAVKEVLWDGCSGGPVNRGI